MLVATICSALVSPAALRENLEVRGSTASMTARPSCGNLEMATQSPTGDERAYARLLTDALGLSLTEAFHDLADVDDHQGLFDDIFASLLADAVRLGDE